MKRYLDLLSKNGLWALLLVMSCMPVWADEVSFQASAPQQVIVGKPFQLQYSVNERSKDLRVPQMDAFELLAGPYTSQSMSTQYINGKRTSSFTQTYTYTLVASKEGTFSLPPATIVVNRQTYTSNGLKIQVLPEDQVQPDASASSSAGTTPSQRPQTASATGSGSISKDNLFVRTVVSKTKVKEQECLTLSYKLYFAGVDVAQFTNNTTLPEFQGFLKQELDLGEIQTELEHYNGRNYNTATLYQVLLYPQHSGKIHIEPASFEAVLRVMNQSRSRSIFDDFFGSYSNVTKTLTAPAVNIEVEPLPAGKPAGFSGGVGRMALSSSLSTATPQTNEAVTLHLEIAGTGNLKLLKTPAVDWPEGFEVYDPKVTNNFKNTSSGMTGTKTIEYLAIPRSAGEYDLEPITFSYYDTQTHSYQTLQTEPYHLSVARGADDQTAVTSTFVPKEDIKSLNTDIRYIYTGALPVVRPAKLEAGNLLFWLLYGVPLLLAVVVFVLFRRQLKENADLTKVRYKKANKVAQKALRRASKLLHAHEKEAFYEEIERACWTYLSDRLSIPTADLSQENIASILRSKQVPEELIASVLKCCSEAQFARYAPSQEGDLEKMYAQAASVINRLEECKL